LYTFQILKDESVTRHTAFVTGAESETEARARIHKANILADGQTLGELIPESEA